MSNARAYILFVLIALLFLMAGNQMNCRMGSDHDPRDNYRIERD